MLEAFDPELPIRTQLSDLPYFSNLGVLQQLPGESASCRHRKLVTLLSGCGPSHGAQVPGTSGSVNKPLTRLFKWEGRAGPRGAAVRVTPTLPAAAEVVREALVLIHTHIHKVLSKVLSSTSKHKPALRSTGHPDQELYHGSSSSQKAVTQTKGDAEQALPHSPANKDPLPPQIQTTVV